MKEKYYHRNNQKINQVEQWERSKRATIWMVLSIIVIFCLLFAIQYNIRDIMLKYKGTAIATEFKNGTSLSGVDEDGNQMTIDFNNETHVTIIKPFLNEQNNSNGYTNYVKAYGKNRVTAYKYENDVLNTVNLRFYNLSLFHDQKINLYYYNREITTAKPLVALWVWLVLYCVLVPLLVLFVVLVYNILYPKSHVFLSKEEIVLKD